MSVLQPLHEAVDRLTALGVGNRGQMGGEGGRLNGLMAERDLNLAQIDSGFEQGRGVRMAQRLHGGVFVDAGLLEGGPKRGLDAVQGHRLRGGLALSSTASAGRTEPERVVLGEPRLPQQFPRPGRRGDNAVFASLAEAHVQQHAGLVEIRDLHVERFFESQTAGPPGRGSFGRNRLS